MGISELPVERRILLIRGQKVMLDSHLAQLYGVMPIRLRQQVQRNLDRFPKDFMFRLTNGDVSAMVSQNVIPSRKYLGGHLPFEFTQEGVAMLSSVLRSPRAIQVNIAIMRAFVKLRELLASHADLARKLMELERKNDARFEIVFDLIGQMRESRLTAPPPRPVIGFKPKS